MHEFAYKAHVERQRNVQAKFHVSASKSSPNESAGWTLPHKTTQSFLPSLYKIEAPPLRVGTPNLWPRTIHIYSGNNLLNFFGPPARETYSRSPRLLVQSKVIQRRVAMPLWNPLKLCSFQVRSKRNKGSKVALDSPEALSVLHCNRRIVCPHFLLRNRVNISTGLNFQK